MAFFYLAIYVFLVICQPGMGTPVSTPQGLTMGPINSESLYNSIAKGVFAGLNRSVYAFAILGVIALIIVIIGGWALWKHIRKPKLPDEEQPKMIPIIRKASIKKEKRRKKEKKQDRKRRKREEKDVEQKEEEKVVDVKEQMIKDKNSVDAKIETKEQGTQTDGTEKKTWKLLEYWINRDLEIQRRREEEQREEEEFFN